MQPTTNIDRAILARFKLTPGLPPAARLETTENRNFTPPTDAMWVRLTMGYGSTTASGYLYAEDRPNALVDIMVPVGAGVADATALRDAFLATFKIGALIPVPGDNFHLRTIRQDPGTWRPSGVWQQLPLVFALETHRDR